MPRHLPQRFDIRDHDQQTLKNIEHGRTALSGDIQDQRPVSA